MQYPDLIWTALVIIGSFSLLSGHEKNLNKTNLRGVYLIFAGFLVQVYWRLATHPTGGDIFGINANIVGVTIIVVLGILFSIWLDRRRSLKSQSKE